MNNENQINNELLDLVDDNDIVIGNKYRNEVYTQNLSNFRVINAFLINDQNQVWIPRRSQYKKLFPLCLDASVGGHVAAGESYEKALIRETQEELNLDLTKLNYKLIAKLSPKNDHVSAHMQVYIIKTNHTPNYNQEDFVSADWYDLEKLNHLIKNGEPTKGDLPKLISILINHIN